MIILNSNRHNPFLNNRNAHVNGPQVLETQAGRLYTKQPYDVAISTFTRVLKIVQVVALVIISCFIALAFERVRKLWSDAIQGFENVAVLNPQDFFEYQNMSMVILPTLTMRELIAMRAASTLNKTVVDLELIRRLNAEEITPFNLGINTVSNLISYFDNNCSKIFVLNLRNFINKDDISIQKIYENFTRLQTLLMFRSSLSNFCTSYLGAMLLLRTISLFSYTFINDFSFLSNCKQLTNVALPYLQILGNGNNVSLDLSFLKECPQLTHLDLRYCEQIDDFSYLQHCPHLKSINFSGCKIKDLSFLQHCQSIIELNFDWCYRINDFSPIGYCSLLKNLSFVNCEIKDVSFLEQCNQLMSLNFKQCYHVNDFSPLQHCKNLTHLNFENCQQINDFSFLEHLKELTKLNLYACGEIGDISFLQHSPQLKEIYLLCCQVPPAVIEVLRNKGIKVTV